MFEHFSEPARNTIVLAQEEARTLGHGHIGTEHLLLGLIADGTGAAGRAFAKLGVTHAAARDVVAALMPPTTETPPQEQIPFSPRAKATLEASLRQALGFKDTTIETEHMLLALLIERDGRTASVFASLACPPDLLRATVIAERGVTATATPDLADDGAALLALARGPGVAGRALADLGVTPEALEAAITRARSGS
jgi:ATP-dependent Clp protease ATP-binding subunit ClpA